jgi:exopolysaccharide biosynthesis polyprenyl glycosylphosphotransferase
MFRRHYRTYAKLMLVADATVCLVALFLGYHSRRYLVLAAPAGWAERFSPELLPIRDYLLYFFAFLPILLLLLAVTQRYPQLLEASFLQQLWRVVQFAAAAGFAAGFLSYAFKLIISRPVLMVFLALASGFLVLVRVLFLGVLRSRTLSDHNRVNILLVGANGRAEGMARRLASLKRWGYDVIGYLSTTSGEPALPNLVRLGSARDLPAVLQEQEGVDEVIFLGSDARQLEDFEDLIRFCEELGVRTRLAVDFFPASASRISLDFLERVPLLTFATAPDHGFALLAKRVLDFSLACVLLVVLSPLMLLVAIAIRLSSPGPALYRQVRCGLYGRRFRLIKFRTMVNGAEDRLWEIRHLNEMDGPVFKMRNDPRVTPFGQVLRKSSLDELPQLWNVIKGEMSLVGPRAPLPEEVKYYAVKQRRRLSVKPGITCLWQVSGRSDIDFHRWMEMDLHYIDHWSFWLDLLIMAKTIPAVFSGRGAR